MILLFSLLFLALTNQTALTPATIKAFNDVYPRCWNASAKASIRSVEEEPALFSTKYKVTLAPKGKCSFLGQGNTRLDWDMVEDTKVQN
jgi:hypothetical protein